MEWTGIVADVDTTAREQRGQTAERDTIAERNSAWPDILYDGIDQRAFIGVTNDGDARAGLGDGAAKCSVGQRRRGSVAPGWIIASAASRAMPRCSISDSSVDVTTTAGSTVTGAAPTSETTSR